MKKFIKVISLIVILSMLTAVIPIGAYAADTPKLSSLSLDGGYSIEFDKNTFEYTVFIPAGRPRLPRISASAEDGTTVKIFKPALSDTDTVGNAYITAENEAGATVYTVRFIRSEKLGFVLQCDDVYTFGPSGLANDVTFTSSDPSVISVTSKSGILTAKKASNNPVTVTAQDQNGKTEKLTVRRVDKAQLDIVMSVGQSNAYGRGGDGALADKVKPGTAYDIGYDGNTQTSSNIQNPIPLASSDGKGTAVAGVRQAFADEWYSTTGEKILFINAADPGVKISTWQPNGNVYLGAKKEYDRVKELMKDNAKYEIYREFFYFNHGSADAGGNFNASYHQMVVKCFETLFANTDLEFGTIFEYFSSDRSYTTWIRSQHNRIVSEMDNIYMGCEMKPYIQADGSLINSDNLHLSQKGHNLCGRIMAKNTAAQALAPGCKYSSSSLPVQKNDTPALSFSFNGDLSNSCGSTTLSLGGGTEKYNDEKTALSFSDGETWYKLSETVKLRNTSDWLIETTFKLDGSTTGFALLGSPDNSTQIYVNLSDGTTKGFKVRYGNEGAEGTAITLSVRDTKDMYSMNTWRFYYRSELNLLYLYKGNELQSTEILPGGMNISQIGKTGTITTASKTATVDDLKIFYSVQSGGTFGFEFENNLDEENQLITLTSLGNDTYVPESINLKLSKNDYSFDEITLNKEKDWVFETRGSFAKNSAVLASADGSNTIFANVSDPGFRVRSTSSTYVKLKVGTTDFSEIHTWRIEFKASDEKIVLYKDGTQVTSASLNSSLKFTHMGTSGTTGTSNSAIIDYVLVEQIGVNKGTSDKIIFNFDNSLSDDSGNYTMKLVKGSTAYTSGSLGYVFSGGKTLKFSKGIDLTLSNSFELSVRGKFTSNGAVIPNVLSITPNGFEFCGRSFNIDDKDLFALANTWTFTFDRNTKELSLNLPDGKTLKGGKLDKNFTVNTFGGADMTLFSFSFRRIENVQPEKVNVEVKGNAEKGEKLVADVSSDIWNISTVSVRYQWLRDGHVIPGATQSEYTPITNDIGKKLSCSVILCGTPEQGVSLAANAVSSVKETLPEPADTDIPFESDSETVPTVPTGSDTEPPTSKDEPTSEPVTTGNQEKGCKSTIVSPVSVTALIAVAYIATKKKKR